MRTPELVSLLVSVVAMVVVHVAAESNEHDGQSVEELGTSVGAVESRLAGVVVTCLLLYVRNGKFLP